MKSMIALALAGVVAMSTPVLVDAANINASKYAAAYGLCRIRECSCRW